MVSAISKDYRLHTGLHPTRASAKEHPTPEIDMTAKRPRDADVDVLVFYLTSKLSQQEAQDLFTLIEAEQFKDKVVTVEWPHEHSGTQEDIERLSRQAAVEGKPFQALTVVYIDDESPHDKKVTIVDFEDGEIRLSRRMLASHAGIIAVGCNLCCLALEDAVEED